MSKGILVVVSGFSGSGKGTVMKRLMEKYDNYALSVSVTTRNPRPGEKDGEAYFFRTKEEFEQLIREDGLIEYAQYVAVSYTHLTLPTICSVCGELLWHTPQICRGAAFRRERCDP